MATPIQFIREQIANNAIDPSKIDLATSGITYDYSAVAIEAATQSQEDNSTKVATTAYVDTAVANSLPSGGAGINIDNDGLVSVDIDIASSGLTFSGTGNTRKLIAAVSTATPRGLALNADGFLQAKIANSGAIDIAPAGHLQVMVESGEGIIRTGSAGLALNYNVAMLEVDSSDGLQVIAGGISATELASDSVVSAKIADGAIDTTAFFADEVVTNAKLENSTISGVALGANLNALTDGNGIADFSFNGSSAVSIAIDLDGSTLSVGTDGLKISAGGVGTAQLADDAVTTAKILDANVTVDKLAANAVSTVKILDANVTSDKLAAESVTQAKIADDAVGPDQLASNAVVTASIVDANVTNAKLASDSVTNAKLGDDSVGINEIALVDEYQEFSANGSTKAFTLTTAAVLPKFAQIYKNGQRMSLIVSGTPGADEYTLSGTALTFGQNVTSGSVIQVSYLSAGSPA